MTKRNGKPCKKCGTSDWYDSGPCRSCQAESDRQWRQKNQDMSAEYSRRWRRRNPDVAAGATRRYRQTNIDKCRGFSRQWKIANRDKVCAKEARRRTQKTNAGGSYTAEEFKTLCNHYGNKCLRCGICDVKLTADHIVPVSIGGSSDIGNIQPLCGPCNSWKRDKHIDYRPDAGPLRWLQAKLFG